MEKLIFLVGKTSSGKDYMAKALTDLYHIPPVVSYTTRPMRESEAEGREHYFVSKEQMEVIRRTEDVVAYTKFCGTNYEYCATLQAMKGDIVSYIIDPEGISYFKEKYPEIKTLTVYVECKEETIRERAKIRGDKKEDVENRLNSERYRFDTFFENRENYDILIKNEGTKEEFLSRIKEEMERSHFLEENEVIETMEGELEYV